MSIVIRDVREHELDSILALNNAAGPTILPLDAARIRRFYDTAEYFRVAERDGTLAGFLVGGGGAGAADAARVQGHGAHAQLRADGAGVVCAAVQRDHDLHRLAAEGGMDGGDLDRAQALADQRLFVVRRHQHPDHRRPSRCAGETGSLLQQSSTKSASW